MDFAFAGIGSREITHFEHDQCKKISEFLTNKNYVCYTGGAAGSDTAFYSGSLSNCVIFLPWKRFNSWNVLNQCKDCFVELDTKEARESLRFHPAPHRLSQGAQKLMMRNYYQVMGYGKYPPVQFVVCCANEDKRGNILGGTGQAARIAKAANIEVFNLRKLGDNIYEELKKFDLHL